MCIKVLWAINYVDIAAVSYTHLDVYKRQVWYFFLQFRYFLFYFFYLGYGNGLIKGLFCIRFLLYIRSLLSSHYNMYVCCFMYVYVYIYILSFYLADIFGRLQSNDFLIQNKSYGFFQRQFILEQKLSYRTRQQNRRCV